MIKKLSQDDIGKWVFYKKRKHDGERGKIKNFNNKKKIAWVVYLFDGKWRLWKNYTAQLTQYEDLTF